MAAEIAQGLQFGQVIKRLGENEQPQYWVVTEARPDGYMSYALRGYKPDEPVGDNLEVLVSNGGHTILLTDTLSPVGEIPPETLLAAAHRNIDGQRMPDLLKGEQHETVRRWASLNS